LVKGHALTSGFFNACSGSFGEPQGAHLKLGYFEETDVICDRGNNNCGLVFLSFHVFCKLGETEHMLTDSSVAQSVTNYLVKPGICSSSKKLVQLVGQSEVRIVRLRGRALVDAKASTSLYVDTHGLQSFLATREGSHTGVHNEGGCAAVLT